jgi:hypothetical protein
MITLPSQLRAHADTMYDEEYPEVGSALISAANEVEKLEAALETCRDLRKYDAAEIGRLRVDCDRLREFNTKLCAEIDKP